MNTESIIEDFEELLGLAMAFNPATAPFAGLALATLPGVTHNIITATSGKVDAATQAQLIQASVQSTAQALDAASTGGQKNTLDSITAQDANGNSLLSFATGKIMGIVGAIKAGSTPAAPVPSKAAAPAQQATAGATTNDMLQQAPPA
jgi:hypothetical protein